MANDAEAQAETGRDAIGDGLPIEGYVDRKKVCKFFGDLSGPTFWRWRKMGIIPPPDIEAGNGKLDRWDVKTLRNYRPRRSRGRARKVAAA